jgi:hypothetical protein
MARETKSEPPPQRCRECSEELPGGRAVVHCTRVDARRKKPHHGRWRWKCPSCGAALGCDECVGRLADEVFCHACRIYANGHRPVQLTSEERHLMIALVPHSSPTRAITLSRLASDLSLDELHVKALLGSLRQKGLVGALGGERYFLQPHAEADPPVPPLVGIELSLPLSDRVH